MMMVLVVVVVVVVVVRRMTVVPISVPGTWYGISSGRYP
jgi:hypothetical protein